MPQSSIITFEHTATDDLKFSLAQADVWIASANIHVLTHAAKYGDTLAQEAQIAANNVVWFNDFNLKDLFFKNASAGDNTVVRIVAVRMTEGRKEELGLI